MCRSVTVRGLVFSKHHLVALLLRGLMGVTADLGLLEFDQICPKSLIVHYSTSFIIIIIIAAGSIGSQRIAGKGFRDFDTGCELFEGTGVGFPPAFLDNSTQRILDVRSGFTCR
uniref:Uncharacterized protein n=1 Tax=Anopheles farauti TaxID=69004 RepID=A0A182Q8J2_9DIPT